MAGLTYIVLAVLMTLTEGWFFFFAYVYFPALLK